MLRGSTKLMDGCFLLNCYLCTLSYLDYAHLFSYDYECLMVMDGDKECTGFFEFFFYAYLFFVSYVPRM